MIEVANLSKRYGRQLALDSVSLTMRPGLSVALIGPNGSGKTTLIKCILGLVRSDSGTILVNGADVERGFAYRRDIGYMPQISQFPDHMKVYQLFELISSMRPDYPKDTYDRELYDAFKIEHFDKKALGALSGGMKQQVSAALAFFFNPSIIILDEPTAGLDPLSNEKLKAKINKCVSEGKLVLTTSHMLSDLDEIADHVVYLMEGRLIFFKSLVTLQRETAETKLHKIMVALINQETRNAES